MPLSFYFDQHVPAAIARALRMRGVDVLAAREDGHDRAADEKLLLRATSLNRVHFTQDEDLLALAHHYQAEGRHFARMVYAHQMAVSIGRCVADLEVISKATFPQEMNNRVEFLPL